MGGKGCDRCDLIAVKITKTYKKKQVYKYVLGFYFVFAWTASLKKL